MTAKMNVPSAFFLLAPLSLILAMFACRFSPSQPTGLHMNKNVTDGSISGSYHFSKDLGRETVQFSVSADGVAVFRLEDALESQVLTVDFSSKEAPSMNWKASDLDGMGALSSEEKAILDSLNNSKLAHGLAMIPLDVACQGGDSSDPAQIAALLYPLQMRFKYQVTDRAALAIELLAISQCNYGSENGEVDKNSSLIMMTPSSPVPVVLGYFPFDEIGAVETSSVEIGTKMTCLEADMLPAYTTTAAGLSLADRYLPGAGSIEDEWGPCNAKCRGACGPDCTHDNCKLHIDERCEKNQEGDNSGFFSLVYVYSCGLHPACIKHDACYDDCNRRHGCNSWAAAFCMHGMTLVSAPLEYFFESYLSCDSATLLEENPVNVKDWVRGYGPQPDRQVFEYHDREHSYEYDPVTCPLKDDQEQSGSSTEETAPSVDDITPLTTYVGTGEWFSVRREGKMESVTSEIIISVAEDGTVTGSMKLHDVEITYHNTDDDCSGHWEHWIDGAISGRLNGNTGVITFTENLLAKNFSSCPDISPGYNGTFSQLADVEINGDTLTGATQPDPDDPDEVWGFTFTAVKQ